MPNIDHPVITKGYPENQQGGILVCGINFGFSSADEERERSGETQEKEPMSFFSDSKVNCTRFRDRLLTWFSLWDMPLVSIAGNDGAFERSFFQTNWLNTQTNSVTSDGDITQDTLVDGADGILELLRQRKPKIIILVGSKLIEALNDMRLRARVEAVLGPRPGNATVHKAIQIQGQKRSFKVYTQLYGNARVLCLPHVQARGLTNDYMAGFKSVVRSLFLAD